MSAITDRIDQRLAEWVDDEAERDLPVALFGKGVQDDYKRVLVDTTSYDVAKLAITLSEVMETSLDHVKAALDRALGRPVK